MILIPVPAALILLLFVFHIAIYLSIRREYIIEDLSNRASRVWSVILTLFPYLCACFFLFLWLSYFFAEGDYSQVKVKGLQEFRTVNKKLVVLTLSGHEYTLASNEEDIGEDEFLFEVNDEQFSDCFVPAGEPIVVARIGKLCFTDSLKANKVYVNRELYNQLMGGHEIPVSDWDGEQNSSSQEEWNFPAKE